MARQQTYTTVETKIMLIDPIYTSPPTRAERWYRADNVVSISQQAS